MKVVIADDYKEACRFAVHFFRKRLAEKPENFVLGLATGRTMTGIYDLFAEENRAGNVFFENCVTFNLDEYVKLPEEHPASYHSFMNEHLFSHIVIPPENIHIPDGNASDLVEEALSYEEMIKSYHGIDLQLLGVGANGHIAFNEPGSNLSSQTRVKKLNDETRLANSDDFGGDLSSVPKYVITMGIGTILSARFILLVASGAEKAGAVASMIEGPVTAQCPASALQFHKHAFVVADREAASLLKKTYETVREAMSDPYEEYLHEA